MKTISTSTLRRKVKSRDPGSARSVFAEIRRDHSEFRKTMARIKKLYPANPDLAKAAYAEFRVVLQAHAEAEERTLYSALLAKSAPGKALDDEVREGTEEHHVADLLVNELTQIPAIDPKWKAKFHVLCESVEHHLDEEEEYFADWGKRLLPAENAAILDQFLRSRAALIAEAPAVRH